MSEQDLYQTLGIEKNSSDADIKKAYRKLAMKYHPDRNPDDSAAEQKFKSIQKAYAVLSDKQKRAAYDQFGHAGVNPQGGMVVALIRAMLSMTSSEMFLGIFLAVEEVRQGVHQLNVGQILDIR